MVYLSTGGRGGLGRGLGGGEHLSHEIGFAFEHYPHLVLDDVVLVLVWKAGNEEYN
jgi:hypothetical protein